MAGGPRVDRVGGSSWEQEPGPSGGAYAAGLIKRHVKDIVTLQSGVLKDEDPEPLHQLRVHLRKLRTLLVQFGPALVLPERLTEQGLAKTGRRLGLVRDLDVLAGQIQEQLPRLPAPELAKLKPVQKALGRSRKQAFLGLTEELRSRRYLRMLAKLQGWIRQPLFTAFGEEPAQHWLLEWKTPVLAGLGSHPGWRVQEPDQGGACLHDLRKRIKQARYGLANLRELEGEGLDGWLARFQSQQDSLGALNDLFVLNQALGDQLLGNPAQLLPELSGRLQVQQRELWGQWQPEASSMLGESGRNGLRELLCHGSLGRSLSPGPVAPPAEGPQGSATLTARKRAADLKQS